MGTRPFQERLRLSRQEQIVLRALRHPALEGGCVVRNAGGTWGRARKRGRQSPERGETLGSGCRQAEPSIAASWDWGANPAARCAPITGPGKPQQETHVPGQ